MRRGRGEVSHRDGDALVEVRPLSSSRVTHLQRLRHSIAARVVHPTFPLPSGLHNNAVLRRQRCCSRRAVALLAVIALMLLSIVITALRSDAVPDVEMERLPLASEEPANVFPPVQPARVKPRQQTPVSLVMPLVGYRVSKTSEVELLQELLSPLLLSEAALCHRADDGAGVAAVVHAVVMSRVSAAAVGAAVRDVVAAGCAVEGEAVGDGGAGGELTPGARWRAWELSVAAVRGVLGVSGGGGDGGAARCLSDVVTVVGHAMEGGGAVYSEEPADTLEVLVDAALRTRGGSAGSHFIVLPSFLGASRMTYTEPGDVAEVRRAGTGLVDALLRTATTRNGGRVAAAQCTILGITKGKEPPTASFTAPIPEVLTSDHLRHLQVLDKGGMVGSTHHYMMLMPFLARRFSGYVAHDQRVSWEEVVDAASLHCGIFSRTLYNATGGFAGALSVSGAQSATSLIPDHMLAAPDRGGWALSLRMQEMYPEWQVWGSRGVAVLRDDQSIERSSPLVQSLFMTLFSIRDDYGMRMSSVLDGLQRRRVGQLWSSRLVKSPMWNSTAVPPYLPAVIVYGTDFDDPCCGLNREAMSYIRPLVERYSVRTRTATQVCAKPGDALLDVAYHTRNYKRVLSRMDGAHKTEKYWRDALQQHAHIDFLHMRPSTFSKAHKTNQRGVVSVTVSRSLSELSNIPADWIPPMRDLVDEVWTTADFFATIYRRNGIDPRKIRVVPEAVDVYDYDPANYQRRPVVVGAEGSDGFDSQPGLSAAERMQRYVFFANFKWEDRKGWDVLLGAYWDAFGPGAPPELRGRTTLVIKTRFEAAFARGVTIDNLVEFVEAWGKLGSLPGLVSIADYPHLVVLSASMSSAAVTQLYASADAFVFPSKAEGWGLPATEAMAMGLPVLLTDWGGMRRFITPDTCFRIPLDGLKEIEAGSPYGYAEGMKMAVPSREKTAELMRYVLRHPEHAQRVGRRARELIVREMSEEAVADTMDRLFLNALAQRA